MTFLSNHQLIQLRSGHVPVTTSVNTVMTRSRCCHTIRHSHDQVTLLSYYHSHDQVTLLSHHQTTQSGPGHVVVTLSDSHDQVTLLSYYHSHDQVTLLSHHQTTQSGPGHVAVTPSDNTVRTRSCCCHTIRQHSQDQDTLLSHQPPQPHY